MTDQPSTLALLDQIQEVEASNAVPVLTGNTSDLYVGRTGAVLAMPYLLAHEAAEQGYATVVFSLARGSRELTLGGRVPASGLRHVRNDDGASVALADLLAQLDATAARVRLVVDYSDLLLPATGGTDSVLREQERVIELLAEQALAQAAQRTPHRLVVLSRAGGGMDPRLSQLPGFRTIAVGLPNLAERTAILQRLMNPAVGAPLTLADDLDLGSAAALTGGLVNFDLVQARDLCHTTGTPLTRSWVQSRKSETIARLAGDALIVYTPGQGLADVAGLPQVRLLIDECGGPGALHGASCWPGLQASARPSSCAPSPTSWATPWWPWATTAICMSGRPSAGSVWPCRWCRTWHPACCTSMRSTSPLGSARLVSPATAAPPNESWPTCGPSWATAPVPSRSPS